MQKDTFWNARKDSCNVGEISIKRIVDLEHVPFDPSLVFPDAKPEIIKKLTPQVGLQHFSDNNLVRLTR